ncbi:nucleotide sugar dehydrogenase [Bacillus horti]|nr:nucleotide sugar dehydrogenase [Bacillus horti]
MDVFEKIVARQSKLAIIGLGYVGLPIALAFSKHLDVIGFDSNEKKIEGYLEGIDPTGDVGIDAIKESKVEFSSDMEILKEASIFIITVPTPIKSGNVPDLKYVKQASRMIGQYMKKGDLVIYESTVYPGVTEEICLPILEEESGLTGGTDFKIGYSPERINPGDKEHTLENIVKIVSGMDEQTLELVAKLYELIIKAGVFKAESIKVAEAAKVIENAQRDINIAFMNELSMLFQQMKINTSSVLEAARTKWNFLPFKPGLVGGHCIGIDPYYLTYKAEDVGYHSKIILASRHINDGMGKYVAENIIKTLVRMKQDIKNTRIAIFGLTYKENCTDIRNTKVTDILKELKEYDMTPLVVDPFANPLQAYEEYGIELSELPAIGELNVAVVAIPHQPFVQMGVADFNKLFSTQQSKIMMDVKGIYSRAEFERNGFYYWSL